MLTNNKEKIIEHGSCINNIPQLKELFINSIDRSRYELSRFTKSIDLFTLALFVKQHLDMFNACHISAYALKRLMNHKMTNDVTAGSIITDVERLRKPMQLITEYFLKCMGIVKSADIIEIQHIQFGSQRDPDWT